MRYSQCPTWVSAANWPSKGHVRVLLVIDRPRVLEGIKLALNHGMHTTRIVSEPPNIVKALADWNPPPGYFRNGLLGTQIIALVNRTLDSGRLPVIGLTPRGDLKGDGWSARRSAV
jgi:hypothetical protein